MNIYIKNCNTEYIKSLFTLFNISFSSITNIYFRNNNAYVYFINSFSKLYLLSCSRLFRSKLIGNDHKYIFIRYYLDKEIIKRGRVYYHALISKLITDFKSVFNYKTKNYESRPLINIYVLITLIGLVIHLYLLLFNLRNGIPHFKNLFIKEL